MKRKPSQKRRTSFPTKILLGINIIVALLLLCSLLASVVTPEFSWIIAFAGLGYPVLLILNLFFVLFWLVFLKRFFLLSLVTIAIGYYQLSSFLQFRSHDESMFRDKDLKILSYNVRLFDLYQWKSNEEFNRSRTRMMDLIRKESPDIICLQEYYNGKKSQSNYADTILRSGKCKYHYDAYIHNGKKELPFGLITFSKYPILAARKVQYSNTYQSYCIVVDIALPNDTVRVINTHLESIRFGKEDYLFVNDLSTNTGKTDDLRQGSRVILAKIKHAFQKRGSQADELSEMIKNSPYKVILCADLNDTPSSYAYRKINSSLNDAFKEAGSGIGQTYTGFLPILRIDYIFADRSFRIAEYRTINNKLSDHYPIVSRIALQ